ncbi:hypothetical protein [Streptomyces pacificus]|uniref:Uncharacterized protein n=1 Tax=Streptomyces pacificus TaxID=2705029 RepID=A0A6A0AS22_9ACTN|nr:hypothetical protein [Streptomyces pacificus]GFH35719.1 hypothetical protein SCWH03_19410 [Streptomyces pacificus]
MFDSAFTGVGELDGIIVSNDNFARIDITGSAHGCHHRSGRGGVRAPGEVRCGGDEPGVSRSRLP